MAYSIPVADVPRGCLTEGDEVVELGVVEAVSMTAYMIAGRWVPFGTVHGRPAPTTPLVVLR